MEKENLHLQVTRECDLSHQLHISRGRFSQIFNSISSSIYLMESQDISHDRCSFLSLLKDGRVDWESVVPVTLSIENSP